MKIASHLRELFIDENWSMKLVKNIIEKISMIFVYKKLILYNSFIDLFDLMRNDKKISISISYTINSKW